MDLVGLLIVVFLLCLLLWIVNASGWMPLPPPFRWGFNVVVLVIFLLMALQISGVYQFHDAYIGRR